ncbi:copper homeostasis protein CutC [Modestobacter sp. NPDC049651]|uniref:copper homeostasis protein CutC n=1 Tax=unclassified Modestobacter TaxID=2643866 RepID=UPI0033DCDF2A
MTLVEICVDDVAGARTAERAGADRVELCADLLEGGITPSAGMVERTLAEVRRVGVQVLVRPRGGDFVYDADEVAVMRADIRAVRALAEGAVVPVGFVLSALTVEDRVDREVLAALVDECRGAPTTFSKAFDQVPDRRAALADLADLGVHRVLTSGGAATAAEGADELRALAADGRVAVLAGGSVRSANVADLLRRTGVPEVHLRAPGPAGGRPRTSPDEVAAVLDAVRAQDAAA